MKGLIIGGGNVNDELICEQIKEGGYDLIIAADAGMEVLYRHHLTPDIIVGDFDSVGKEALSYFKQNERVEMIELSPIKDDTDTEYAIRDAISRGMTKLVIFGATGKRIDHVLGNIALLGIGIENDVEILIYDEHNRIRLVKDCLTIPKKEQYGNFVSILPYGACTKGVTLTGFKYNLSESNLGGFNTLGISNQIEDEEAVIQVKEGILLVIESRD